ncbi:NACHT domain-containing protein [Actinoplanes sp. CA-252034]|uniref:NACHT domain-containing protein n=1 Tax=Actinoplanes sp. CA-252034 TaxID=3239906 RepID=UPI003D986C7D
MTGSPYTLESAREVLLGERPKVIKVLDALLGVGILAAGPAALLTGQPWLLLLWGWVDQKNELVTRLDELVAAGRDKLRTAEGKQRHEVLAATHTALVAESYFIALRRTFGPILTEMGVTHAELKRLAGQGSATDAGVARDAVSQLLEEEIPLPWAGLGFAANLKSGIEPYYNLLAQRSLQFFAGFEAWQRKVGHDEARLRALQRQIVDEASGCYQAGYKKLIADVPEFRIWSIFGEHRAEQDALGRLEALTSMIVSRVAGPAEQGIINGINRAILLSPIVDLSETAEVTAVSVPTVERGYVEPGFRWAEMQSKSRPADEDWWREQPRGANLAAFLAAYFASPQAASRPILVLGHPGSGKSLLTKICAARLSASSAFVTVRVPLRDVSDPSVSVYRQIEETLRESTHGRVEWNRLCASTHERTRVVLIDGLDELMQATGATESRYLRNVMDFQRTESITGGPVAVMVTSRTVVADLAAVPEGCLLVRLEDFDDDQIDAWAQRWARANAAGMESGAVRPITGQALRRYGELARQPLLLLLLAIVAAERDLPAGDNSASLYRILLDDFIRRELARPDRQAATLTDEQRRTAELWKLGVVAFGMLNRGRQHLHEHDLAADLLALPGPVAVRLSEDRDVGRILDPARRLVGRFFFVNTSEAESGRGGRSYEFLHATFGDFLVAHHTVELLRAAAIGLDRPNVFQPWDDDLLFALLSHTLLIGFGSRTIAFLRELATDDNSLARVLEHLIGESDKRWGPGRHGDYRPSGRAVTHRLAAYTANLVAIRLAVTSGSVPLARLCPPSQSWRAQVRFWDSMLGGSSLWENFMSIIEIDDDCARLNPSSLLISGYPEDTLALLEGDVNRATQLTLGRMLMWGPDFGGVIDQVELLQAQQIMRMLLSRFVPASELTWAERLDEIPVRLVPLAALAAAAHASDLSADGARLVAAELQRLWTPVANDALVRLRAQRPELEVASRNGQLADVHKLMGQLSDFIRQRDGSRFDDHLIRFLLDMPQSLAYRILPEVASFLMAEGSGLGEIPPV